MTTVYLRLWECARCEHLVLDQGPAPVGDDEDTCQGCSPRHDPDMTLIARISMSRKRTRGELIALLERAQRMGVV